LFEQGIAKPALRALELISNSKLANQFYLAGGTGAALQLGHRLSVDLDFFSMEDFSGENLAKQLNEDGLNLLNLQPSKGTLHAVINDTKISFLHYPYPLLAHTVNIKNMAVANLQDIGLMKITAIASRGAKKDFIDLHFILEKYPLKDLFSLFSKKYPIEKIEPYHYLKSLTYFVDAENDPEPIMVIKRDWEEIKQSIRKQVKTISII
jgi:hypothetical protein